MKYISKLTGCLIFFLIFIGISVTLETVTHLNRLLSVFHIQRGFLMRP